MITHPNNTGSSPILCSDKKGIIALSGKLCFNSLWPVANVTGQGNGLRSRIVREKSGGPGITVLANNNAYKKKVIITTDQLERTT